MGDWRRFYRIAHRRHEFRAKRAEGGELYGHPAMNHSANQGQWLCESLENGHRWVCPDDAFVEMYCEVGQVPPKKKKKQEDGYRKGQSRHRSASHEGGQLFAGGEGKLFHDEEEET